MSVILGIDLGSSATKLAALRTGGSAEPLFSFRSGNADRRLPELIGCLLNTHGFTLRDVDSIVVTGTRAAKAREELAGFPVYEENEFSSIGRGALRLAGGSRGVAVSLGTGTAFVLADGDTYRHLCGTGIGGGTLTGLCRVLTGTDQFGTIAELAGAGRLGKVDLTVGDLFGPMPKTLHPSMTVTNFGHLAPDASPADYAAGVVNLVLQSIGTMSILACQSCGTDTVILTGSLTELPQIQPAYSLFEQLYGIRFLLPPHAVFATAVGAALTQHRA